MDVNGHARSLHIEQEESIDFDLEVEEIDWFDGNVSESSRVAT